MKNLFIGILSGTSADGIDAALVDFHEGQPRLIASHYVDFSKDLRETILSLSHPGHDEINKLAKLDVSLGLAFSDAVTRLLEKNQIHPSEVQAIGSHGQTIRHLPKQQFTMQIGDPNIIAAATGITTVSDFRRKDMALGGQGAPLVPAFHQHILSTKDHHRAVVNIGGIANVTLLSKDPAKPLLGFDTGPGNNLLDAWISMHLQKPYDKGGEWAEKGTVNPSLLNAMLNDPYFKKPPPKSTGPEYFDLAWLKPFLPQQIEAVDVQATLVMLTALSIIHAIKTHFTEGEILVCGGGVHNHFLMKCLSELSGALTVHSTQVYGIDPDWMEAIAFAWLAKQTLEKKPGNIISVTGAKKAGILGGIYYAD